MSSYTHTMSNVWNVQHEVRGVIRVGKGHDLLVSAIGVEYVDNDLNVLLRDYV